MTSQHSYCGFVNVKLSIMATRSDISLRSFYIFNSNYGPKEGDEEKKILFYYPSGVDVDTKVKDVGLSEAIIKFAGTFTSGDSCQSLHTQKTVQIFHQPEKDFWMIMTINAPHEIKNKDGTDVVEYRGGDIHETLYRALLKQSYQMFRLFAGTFEMNLVGNEHEDKVHNLMGKLKLFFSKYLLTIKLQTCDIIDVVRSLQYHPLPKFLFLRVHNFINMIEATFPVIKNCIFLYNEQLVWSEVSPSDLHSIYEYLMGTLFPVATHSDLQGGSIPRSYSSDFSHYGSFLTGPEAFENCVKIPKVYITYEDKLTSFSLVVYRALGACICLFVDEQVSVLDDFYQELHSFMGPQLTSIASEIGDSFTKTSSSSTNLKQDADEASAKFLFINELNLQHTGTIYLDNRRRKQPLFPQFVMNLITDLYDRETPDSKGLSEECVIKSLNDYWIVKKTSNWRHFYVIVNNNKATLMDISNEANRLFDQNISNVFFEK